MNGTLSPLGPIENCLVIDPFALDLEPLGFKRFQHHPRSTIFYHSDTAPLYENESCFILHLQRRDYHPYWHPLPYFVQYCDYENGINTHLFVNDMERATLVAALVTLKYGPAIEYQRIQKLINLGIN